MAYTDFKIGEVFNQLVVTGSYVSRKGHRYYPCKCVCGVERLFRGTNLRNGKAKSCGHFVMTEARKSYIKSRTTGNLAKKRGTIEYFKCLTWGNINKRTINGYAKLTGGETYKRKGTMLLMSKDEFYIWCDQQWSIIKKIYESNGTPSIDRIDNDGHYSIDNIQILEHSDNIRKRFMEEK